MRRYLFALFGISCLSVANATGLHGMATVNVTSDTAALAKNMAMAEARRQIVSDVLGQYSDKIALTDLLAGANDTLLTTMIATTEIDGEQTSDTTYSANISMTLDANVVREWLFENNVQHWLPDSSDKTRFIVIVNLQNPVADWGELNRIARDERIDFQTKLIQGTMLRLEIPVAQRGAFTIAARENGWRFENMDTGLRIWK